MRPRIQRLLAEHGGNVRLITMTSRRQADQFIAQIEAESATGSGDRGLDRRSKSGLVHRMWTVWTLMTECSWS
jgi:hypothetical protein